MDIEKLTERATVVKDLYKQYENKEGLREWQVREVYDGLVSDVGDLGRLVLAKEGFRKSDNLDASMEHELAEILYATLLLAKYYNVDIEKAFVHEMDTLEAKLLV